MVDSITVTCLDLNIVSLLIIPGIRKLYHCVVIVVCIITPGVTLLLAFHGDLQLHSDNARQIWEAAFTQAYITPLLRVSTILCSLADSVRSR